MIPHGLVCIRDRHRTVLGSGVLVAADKVITAAHVVENMLAEHLRVDAGDTADEHVVSVVSADDDLDLALLTLRRAQPFQTRVRFATHVTETTIRGWTGRRVYIHGHPDADGAPKSVPYALNGDGVTVQTDARQLVDEFADPQRVPEGYSGGPVWVDTDDGWRCLGIVTHGGRMTRSYAAYAADRCLAFLDDCRVDIRAITQAAPTVHDRDARSVTVILEQKADHLEVRYPNSNLHHRRIDNDDEPWKSIRTGAATPDGDALFRLLFGDETNACHRLAEIDPAATCPASFAIPLLIETNSAGLIHMPWARTAWRHRALVDLGWSIVLGNGRMPYKITIDSPPEILVLDPDATASRRQTARSCAISKTRVVPTFDALREELEHYPPDVVRIVAPLEPTDPSALHTPAGPLRVVDVLAALPRFVGIVFLDVIGDHLPTTSAIQDEHDLLLFLRAAPQRVELDLANDAWWARFSGGSTDSITVFQRWEAGATHPAEVRRTTVLGPAWIASRPRSSKLERDLARYALDRIDQRAIATDATRLLLRDNDVRVGLLIGAGTPANLVEYLPSQIDHQLRRERSTLGATIVANHLEWPEPSTAMDFDTAIQKAFGWEDLDRPDFWSLLLGGVTLRLLVVDHVLPRNAAEVVTRLAECLIASVGKDKHFPATLRILLVVAVLADEASGDLSKQFAKKLRLQPKQIMVRALGDLEHVYPHELSDFLRIESKLNKDLVDAHVRAILRKTGGDAYEERGGVFNRTVAWVEWGIRTDWKDFLATIQESGDWPPYYHRALLAGEIDPSERTPSESDGAFEDDLL